ncbi:protein WVD2-like 7 isoform X1 [Senna tora]|uniref:Protein WVD2-like 7 isoform X1 n=1 Tax=Senna tora TaxID=362788 RepID=A0A834W423_9FABA|nr:protein WVD2-like 7 isoform X1 [Senna tora]
MAGEVEESFNLNFQVDKQADSIHSGSVSFGRFEKEPLSWERRSSFSHNKYLEEVERFSKPGSVFEKKAYFEAHFKKKGLFGILPSASNDDTVNMYKRHEDTGNSDELLKTENMTVNEAIGSVEETTLHNIMNSSPKETMPIPEVKSSATKNVQIRKTNSSKSSRDLHARILHGRANTEKNASKLATLSTGSMSRTLKDVSRSEEKVIHESKSEKVSRAKKAPESLPCVLKADSRRIQEVKRVNHTVKSTKSDLIRPMASTFNFKSSERAERRKEASDLESFHYLFLGLKCTFGPSSFIKEKTDSEIKKLRKSLNFKATPMPSFYGRALPSHSDGNKDVPKDRKSNKKVQKPKCQGSEAESLSSNLKTRKDQTANKSTASTTQQNISVEKGPPTTGEACSICPAQPTNKNRLPNSVTNNQSYGKKEKESNKGKQKGEGTSKQRNEIRKMSMRSNNGVQS